MCPSDLRRFLVSSLSLIVYSTGTKSTENLITNGFEKKTDLDIELEDKILENTSEWIHKTELWGKTKSDKKRCFDRINYLLKEGFLEAKTEGNKHYFRRNNEISSEKEFEHSEKLHRKWMIDTVKVINNLKKPLFKYVKSKKQYEPRTHEIKHDFAVLDDYITRVEIHQTRIRLAKLYKIIRERKANKRIAMLEKTLKDTIDELLKGNPKETEQIKKHSQRITRRVMYKI